MSPLNITMASDHLNVGAEPQMKPRDTCLSKVARLAGPLGTAAVSGGKLLLFGMAAAWAASDVSKKILALLSLIPVGPR